MYGSQKSHYPRLKCHKNEEKIDNILRNYHTIKTARPISMILVLFFSEDNVLSDEIKICYIFEYQSNENRACCFFFGHPIYTKPKPSAWDAKLILPSKICEQSASSPIHNYTVQCIYLWPKFFTKSYYLIKCGITLRIESNEVDIILF